MVPARSCMHVRNQPADKWRSKEALEFNHWRKVTLSLWHGSCIMSKRHIHHLAQFMHCGGLQASSCWQIQYNTYSFVPRPMCTKHIYAAPQLHCIFHALKMMMPRRQGSNSFDCYTDKKNLDASKPQANLRLISWRPMKSCTNSSNMNTVLTGKKYTLR